MSPVKVLFEDPFVRVVQDDPIGVTRYVRTPVPWPDVAAIEQSFEGLLKVFRTTPLSGGLLIDIRAAVGRNDDAYENVLRRYVRSFMGGFERVAALVATPVGALQVKRLQRERAALEMNDPFLDEASAVRYLLTGARA